MRYNYCFIQTCNQTFVFICYIYANHSNNLVTLRRCKMVAKDTLPEVVSMYPFAFVCNTHDSDQPGEHWVAMYVDEIGDYFDPYGQMPQHAEFTNFMNEHCLQWSPNDHILQSPISTVCGQYCVAFLMFRCRNISMHAFSLLFTSNLIANDCRVFHWLGALNKKC